jgi:predicted enzyme related to lactoylglutathione lyase
LVRNIGQRYGQGQKILRTIFSVKLEETEMMGMKMAFFPSENMSGKVSGGLVQGPMHKPSLDGAKIYFNGNPDLGDALRQNRSSRG